jgi:type VI secretion system protein ImpK
MELVTRIREVTARSFTAIELLRRVDNGALHAFARLREHLMQDLEHAEALARDAFGAPVADDIKYALVALADETAQRQPGPLREFWKPLALQLHYFNDNRAGYGFFDRLAELRADPGRAAALPVYALCLQFGLRGKYEHEEHGGERELRPLRQSVFAAAAALVRAGAPPLARRAPRTGEPRRPAPAARSLLWIGVALALFTAGFYALARTGLAGMTGTLQTRLQVLSPPPPPGPAPAT